MNKYEFTSEIERLESSFAKSYYNDDTFTIRLNAYKNIISFRVCKEESYILLKARVLEWCSYKAVYFNEYIQSWRNEKIKNMLLAGINHFLGTDFSKENMKNIANEIGNAKDRTKTISFIKSNYNFKILK